jgi:hypothetical protein
MNAKPSLAAMALWVAAVSSGCGNQDVVPGPDTPASANMNPEQGHRVPVNVGPRPESPGGAGEVRETQ